MAASQQIRTPTFYFRIDTMLEKPGTIPDPDPYGRWGPPAQNICSRIGPTFVCNGTQIYAVQASQMPSGLQHFKTYSLYYADGQFWTLPYDATVQPVPQDQLGGWHLLSFEYPGNTSASFACYAGPEKNLRSQDMRQAWVRKLLPTTYQTNAGGAGGMNGELPLILGLIAYSASSSLQDQVIQSVFQNGSFIQNLHNEFQGWEQGRGMVVHVWSCLPYSSNQYLQYYERGGYGPIFY